MRVNLLFNKQLLHRQFSKFSRNFAKVSALKSISKHQHFSLFAPHENSAPHDAQVFEINNVSFPVNIFKNNTDSEP